MSRQFQWGILLGVAFMTCMSSVAATSEPDSKVTIIPRPKNLTWGAGAFRLSPKVTVTTTGGQRAAREEALGLAARLKGELGLDARVSPYEKKSTKITLHIEPKVDGVPEGPLGDEGYALRVSSDQIDIAARNDRGLFYAVQSLFNIVRRDGDGWAVPACDVRDWPESAVRGLLIAPGQGFMPLPDLKYRIDQAAANKLNLMHLHLTDEGLFTPRLKCYPTLAGMEGDPNKSYSDNDLREIVRYASDRKIGIVPEISMPGHAERIVELLPQLRCKTKDNNPSTWAMCIGSEETYTFVERVVSELGPLFPQGLFHIGTDEIEFQDIPNCKVRISWRECSVCQERIRKEGLKDERALFYYFIRRTDDIMKHHHKRLMMWNDQIDIGKPDEVTIPTDVLIHFWRIAAPGRGPVDNCDYLGFLKKGYQVVNSYYPETYIDFHMVEKNLLKWNPLSDPEAPAQYQAQVLGGMMCAWSAHDLYRRVLPSAIPLFADRVWNRAPIDNPEAFSRALTRQIFGPSVSPELQDLYSALGAMIPPLALTPDQLAYPATSYPGMTPAQKIEHYRKFIAVLDQEISANHVRFAPALTAYKECLLWLIQQAEKKQ